jgi:hypothetical protein
MQQSGAPLLAGRQVAQAEHFADAERVGDKTGARLVLFLADQHARRDRSSL